MKTILAIALLMFAQLAWADPIPASASGTYEGRPNGAYAGWRCDVILKQITGSDGATNRAIDVDCQTPAGRRRGGMTTLDLCIDSTKAPPLVPDGPCSPNPPFCNTPGLPVFAIIGYNVSTGLCPLGEMYVSIGSQQGFFCRTQIIITTPYPGCSATQIDNIVTTKPGRK